MRVHSVTTQFREYVRLDRKRTDDGLTVPEMERWRGLKRTLIREFSPDVPEEWLEQRHSVRIPARIQVSYERNGATEPGLLTNLSRYGGFIQTRHPFPIGTGFNVRIQASLPEREIPVRMQVMSVGVGPDLQPWRRGMGCRFVGLTPEADRAIADLYERTLK